MPNADDPAWWRGRPVGIVSARFDEANGGSANTGPVTHVVQGAPDSSGLRSTLFLQAHVTGQDLWLNDARLIAAWSEFDECHFRQKAKPILNEHGFSAQGTFAAYPSTYRNCTFERIRFRSLGGFDPGKAWFEDCTFLNCRWDGHRSTAASYVNCTFVGQMNGTVWFGRDVDPFEDDTLDIHDGLPNTIVGNDFTRVQMTANNAWRQDFPLDQQRWPDGYVPVLS